MKLLKIFFPFFFLAALVSGQAGCIRLSAGAWHKGPNDESAKVHEVALDTGKLVNPDAYQPSISMPEE